MNALVTRALAVAAGLVAGLLFTVTAVVLVVGARDRAAAADEHDSATIAAVLAVTTDADALRRAIARTTAGTQGRLAVHLADGTTVGTGRAALADVVAARAGAGGRTLRAAPTADGVPAVLEVSEPAAVVTPGLIGTLLAVALLTALSVPMAVVVGRRPLRSVVHGLRVLCDTAGDIARHGVRVRIRVTGPVELTALAEAINAAADRADQVVAKEREMIADVSHRLRTPLTALRLDADAIGRGPVADRIRSAVTALGRDVDRIIESLQPVAADAPISDVAEVVKARMGFWSAHASDQGRPCEVDLPYEPTLVPLPPDALGAVVDALLDNVFHHTPPRTPVIVAVVRHAGWVTLVVEDGGPGIADPERAMHRGTSGGGSTGLGLDIARAAAEATGGTIHVERGRLGGTRIRLRFGEADSHHEPASPRAWRLWRRRS